ncbi:MAG: hypothetical protein M0R03_14370 [Novosphingobium sp.]|nr:hypothetical protein [Novosphingobium sp.]
MSINRLGAILVGIATVPLIILVAMMLGLGDASLNRRIQYTDGQLRNDRLLELTELYIAQNPHMPGGAAPGTFLAPVPFLNEQLKSSGSKWRVRTVEGISAETYDIS